MKRGFDRRTFFKTVSLALGAALGTVAVLIKQEVLLVLVGGLFVV